MVDATHSDGDWRVMDGNDVLVCTRRDGKLLTLRSGAWTIVGVFAVVVERCEQSDIIWNDLSSIIVTHPSNTVVQWLEVLEPRAEAHRAVRRIRRARVHNPHAAATSLIAAGPNVSLRLGIPAKRDGKRCIDVGVPNGWAEGDAPAMNGDVGGRPPPATRDGLNILTVGGFS